MAFLYKETHIFLIRLETLELVGKRLNYELMLMPKDKTSGTCNFK